MRQKPLFDYVGVDSLASTSSLVIIQSLEQITDVSESKWHAVCIESFSIKDE